VGCGATCAGRHPPVVVSASGRPVWTEPRATLPGLRYGPLFAVPCGRPDQGSMERNGTKGFVVGREHQVVVKVAHPGCSGRQVVSRGFFKSREPNVAGSDRRLQQKCFFEPEATHGSHMRTRLARTPPERAPGAGLSGLSAGRATHWGSEGCAAVAKAAAALLRPRCSSPRKGPAGVRWRRLPNALAFY
jgi:hypothetical protein